MMYIWNRYGTWKWYYRTSTARNKNWWCVLCWGMFISSYHRTHWNLSFSHSNTQIDDDAVQCLRSTHGDMENRLHIFHTDVNKFDLNKIRRRIQPRTLGPINLVVAGFPCQPFSGQMRLNRSAPRNFSHKSGRMFFLCSLCCSLFPLLSYLPLRTHKLLI